MLKAIKECFKYWRGNLLEAKEAHEVTAWVLTIIFIIVGAFLRSERPESEFAKDLTRGELGTVSLWVGGLVATWTILWLPFRRHQAQEKKYEDLEEKVRPKLKIAYSTTIPGCQVETTLARGNIRNQVMYFRLTLESLGTIAVDGCVGCLLEISGTGPNAMVKMGHEPLHLKFANEDDPPFGRIKTVYKGIPAHLDILAALDDNSIMIPTPGFIMPSSVHPEEIFKNKGQYRLLITVTSKTTEPVWIELEFDWTGNWRTAQLKMIEITPTSPFLKSVAA